MDTVRHLKKGEIVHVTGPARIQMQTGYIRIDGVDKSKHILKEGQSCIVEGVQESDIKCVLGSEAHIEEYTTLQTPRMWLKYAHLILQDPGVIMVLGGPDTGKTTFTTFLANKALEKGLSVAVIDSDIGQSDIGSPGTIGLSYVKHTITRLSQVEVDNFYFVGTTSVSLQDVSDMVLGLHHLVSKAKKKADIVLIDTCGYIIGDTGRKLKMMKLQCINPDFVVGLQKKNELYPILKNWHKKIFEAEVPTQVKQVSRQIRREIRKSRWKKAFVGAKERRVDLEEKYLLNTFLLSGTPVDTYMFKKLLQCKVLHAEEIPEGFLVIKKDVLHEYNPPDVKVSGDTLRVLDAGWERNLLVGLLKNGECVDVGILKQINYKNMMAVIYCKEHEFDGIKFGRIQVDESGDEKGFINWC
jgi:polynucleotide 5'-hydroxyl-kinase GRC3/NOL9